VRGLESVAYSSYCKTVEWFWWDLSLSHRLTGFLQCFDAAGWVIWPVKIVPEMTYKVSSGTLSFYTRPKTDSLTHHVFYDAAERCVRSAFNEPFSVVWYRSLCYVTFIGRKHTWLHAANMCIYQNGRLASYHAVFVPFVRANFIPHSCVWVGLVRDYLHWIMSDGQFYPTFCGSRRTLS